jgi:hypothetical protein
MHYRYRQTVYHITVLQARAADDEKSGKTSVTVDGIERHDKAIPLVDDRQEHAVEVRIPACTVNRVGSKNDSARGEIAPPSIEDGC